MIKLSSALNQKMIEAYYNWNADNNMFRFNCLIDVGYLAEPLRKVLMKHKMFDPESGTIILNLSCAACINIDYTGNEFYGEIGFQGMPCHLHIPWHAFLGVQVEVAEGTSVYEPFPSVDRILFDAANPTYVHPFRRQMGNQYEITLDDVIAWLRTKGHEFTDSPGPEVTSKLKELVDNDPEVYNEFINFVIERKNVKHLEAVEPLLSLGEVPTTPSLTKPTILKQPISKYKGKPKLTLIKGGKS